MNDNLTKEELIDVVEAMLQGQLRSLRSLRDGGGRKKVVKDVGDKRSNISIVEDILKLERGPLHINEIIERARKQYTVVLNRESIVSALTKKVLDRRTFRRTGRNEFALIITKGR